MESQKIDIDKAVTASAVEKQYLCLIYSNERQKKKYFQGHLRCMGSEPRGPTFFQIL